MLTYHLQNMKTLDIGGAMTETEEAEVNATIDENMVIVADIVVIRYALENL